MDGLADFVKKFGNGDCYKSYQEGDDNRLKGQIPDVMRRLLQKEGWCSYKNQSLWICDPDDWKECADLYSQIVPGALVLARSAYGDLFIWDGKLFWYVMVHEALVMWTMDDEDWFFSQIITKKQFLPRSVSKAQKLCGKLESDEMYTYVPALALGGSEKTSTVEKVKAKEGIAILASLVPAEKA